MLKEKVGFDTRKELKEKGFEVIHEELVHQTEEWNERINNIVDKVNKELNKRYEK